MAKWSIRLAVCTRKSHFRTDRHTKPFKKILVERYGKARYRAEAASGDASSTAVLGARLQ